MTFNQSEFNIKLEWGMPGIEQLAPVSDVIIIVDVLSFSTSVDIAISCGAKVFPYRYKDDSAVEYAELLGGSACRKRQEFKRFHSFARLVTKYFRRDKISFALT